MALWQIAPMQHSINPGILAMQHRTYMSDKKSIQKAFWDTVKHQISGNRKHGWHQKDSMAVIDAVVAEDAAQAGGSAKDYSLSQTATELINEVVNPSAMRQKLESKDVNMLDKSEVKERKRSIMAGMAKEFSEE